MHGASNIQRFPGLCTAEVRIRFFRSARRSGLISTFGFSSTATWIDSAHNVTIVSARTGMSEGSILCITRPIIQQIIKPSRSSALEVGKYTITATVIDNAIVAQRPSNMSPFANLVQDDREIKPC